MVDEQKPAAWQLVHENERLRDEITRLREAIRRLAEQDATLSVVGGNVIVEMDAALTDAERVSVKWAAQMIDDSGEYKWHAATLRGLLDRTRDA